MGQYPVKQKNPCITARDRTAQATKVIQLSDHSGEGCFTALIGAGYHHDALMIRKAIIVAHYCLIFLDKLLCQHQIEAIMAVDIFTTLGNVWKAKAQTYRLK